MKSMSKIASDTARGDYVKSIEDVMVITDGMLPNRYLHILLRVFYTILEIVYPSFVFLFHPLKDAGSLFGAKGSFNALSGLAGMFG